MVVRPVILPLVNTSNKGGVTGPTSTPFPRPRLLAGLVSKEVVKIDFATTAPAGGSIKSMREMKSQKPQPVLK